MHDMRSALPSCNNWSKICGNWLWENALLFESRKCINLLFICAKYVHYIHNSYKNFLRFVYQKRKGRTQNLLSIGRCLVALLEYDQRFYRFNCSPWHKSPKSLFLMEVILFLLCCQNHHHHHHVQEGLGLIPVPCILKMKLVPPSLPRSSYVSSSFWFIL